MKTILKYPLQKTLALPEGAQVINCQFDPTVASLALWVLVDPSSPQEERHFRAIDTGESLPEEIMDCSYIATSLVTIRDRDNPAKMRVKVAHVWEIPTHVHAAYANQEGGQA